MPAPYDPDDDEGEARLFRQDASEDARWRERCEIRVVRLLATLTPEDADLRLISFTEQRRWKLRRH